MAWWVVLGHLAYVFSDRLGYLSRNRAAVDVFIVLSGFVIFRLLDTRHERPSAFLTRRFFRLFPAYAVVLLLSAVTLGLQRASIGGSPFMDGRAADRLALLDMASKHFWPHLLLHLTMLQGYFPETLLHGASGTFVGQAWSVSVEWQFYWLAPLLFLTIKERTIEGLFFGAAFPVIMIVYGWANTVDNPAFVGVSLPWFGLGIASYFAVKHRPPARWCWAAILALVAASVVTRWPAGAVWAAVLVVMLELAPDLTGWLRAVLRSPLLMWLGRVSYSTYLAHMLVMYLAMGALNPLGLSPVAYGVVLAGLTIAGTLGASWLLWSFVEAPGIAMGSRAAGAVTGWRLRYSPAVVHQS